jgi:hypothetical protein
MMLNQATDATKEHNPAKLVENQQEKLKKNTRRD